METSASSTSLAASSSKSNRHRSRSPGGPTGGAEPSRSGTVHRTPKICTKCGLQLSGQFVRALGGTYHLNCFKCIDCGQIVAAKFFPITDDTTGRSHPLCERDYFARLDLLCAKCGGALRGSYISALGRKYHVEHFTCSQCPTVFGPNESYFEHEGAVFCHFHFSTQYAAICTGCRVAILKQFVEITRNGVEEQWHPECYMIHKSWNVTLAPTRAAIMSRPGSPSALAPLSASSSSSAAAAAALRELPPGTAPSAQMSAELRAEQTTMEEQASRVWSVLSVFEESAAACISDMLLHVSNGHYVEGVHEAALFILHVEVLFAGIDGVDERLARFGDPDQVRLVVPKEPKLLCKKVVGFFSLLSQAGALTESHQQGSGGGGPPRPRLGITQDLLSLVTSLAHLLKVLIRQALVGALKLERTHGEAGAVAEFLDTLMELSEEEYRLRAVLETDVKSDLCHSCRSTIEEACVALGPIRWHINCFTCSACSKSLVDDRHSAKYLPVAPPTTSTDLVSSSSPSLSAGRVLCEACFNALDEDDNHPVASSNAALARSGFVTVSSLSQYTFLLRVALKRLLGLLQVEEEGLSDALADSKRKRVLSGTILDATTAAVAAAAAAAAASSQAQAQQQPLPASLPGTPSLAITAATPHPPAGNLNGVAPSTPITATGLIKPRSDSLPRNASSGSTSAGAASTSSSVPHVSIPRVSEDPASVLSTSPAATQGGSSSSAPASALGSGAMTARASVDPTTSTATITLEGRSDSISRPPAISSAPSSATLPPTTSMPTPSAFQPLHPALQPQFNQHPGQYHAQQQQQQQHPGLAFAQHPGLMYQQPPQHLVHPQPLQPHLGSAHPQPPPGSSAIAPTSTPILAATASSSSAPTTPSGHPAAGASASSSQPADMWLSELGALELFLVRHLAVRELEPLLTARNLMRSDEVLRLIDEGAGKKASGSAGGGIWGKFVNSFVKGGRKKSPSFGSGAGEYHLVNAAVPVSVVPSTVGGSGGGGASAPGSAGGSASGGPTGTGVGGSGDLAPGAFRAANDASPAPNTGSANTNAAGAQANGWATFGVPLDVLVHRSGVSSSLGAGPGRIEIPAFVDACVGQLRSGDLHVEGVFRKNGNIKRLNSVKEALDASPIMALELLREDNPVQNAALLKKFLRELPEPLMTYRLYRLFTASTLIQEENVRRKVLHYGLCLLPKANRDVLEVLLLCLRDVANACQHPTDADRGSKMDYSNLATVIAPNLLIPGKGVEEEHGAIVSCMFDMLMWQETMWTVPRTIAGIIRQSTDVSLGGGGSFGGLGGAGATTNPKELLRRVEMVARSARDAPREHRLSNASLHQGRPEVVTAVAHQQPQGIHAPSNALIEDAAAAAASQSLSTSPTLQSIPPS